MVIIICIIGVIIIGLLIRSAKLRADHQEFLKILYRDSLDKESGNKIRKNQDPMRNPVNRGIAKFGDKMIDGGIVPTLLALDGLNQIKKSIDETQKIKMKRLKKECESKDMFAPYHSYDED